MLQQVCEQIHNYFIKESHVSSYEIAGGMISLPFVLEGQRFLIEGSALNDGMYTYHSAGIKNDDDTEAVGLKDESWVGTVYALAVPPAAIALSSEIKAWVDKHGDIVNSPYSSENVIGVYSYVKAQVGGQTNGNSKPMSWQDVFKDQLNRWRKVAF